MFDRIIKNPIRKVRLAARKAKLDRSPFFTRFPAQTAPELVDSRVRVSTRWQYAYFRIPKAANSTVASNLMSAETSANIDIKSVNEFKDSGIRLSKMTASEVDTMINNFFLFSMVRNPYERTASAFLQKIVGREQPRKKVEEYLEKEPMSNISFDQFLDYLEHGGGIHADAHWARQTDLLAVPINHFSFIGKVEKIVQDLEFIMRQIYESEIIVDRFSPNSTDSKKFLLSCPQNEMQRILRIFEKDFDLLGYSRLYHL